MPFLPAENPNFFGLPPKKIEANPDLICFWEGGGREKKPAMEDTPGISEQDKPRLATRFCANS